MDNGDVQLYNKWRAKFQVETGKTLPNNLEQAAPIIGDEIVKAILPGGGGVEERKKAEERWSAALAKQQAESQIKDVYIPLMRGQADALGQRYKASGKKDFVTRFFTPPSRKALGLQDDSADSHPADIGNLLDKYGKK